MGTWSDGAVVKKKKWGCETPSGHKYGESPHKKMIP